MKFKLEPQVNNPRAIAMCVRVTKPEYSGLTSAASEYTRGNVSDLVRQIINIFLEDRQGPRPQIELETAPIDRVSI